MTPVTTDPDRLPSLDEWADIPLARGWAQPRYVATNTRSVFPGPPRRCPITGARTCRSRHCGIHYDRAPLKLGPYVYGVDRVKVRTFGTVYARMGAPLVEEWWGTHPDSMLGVLVLTARPRTYVRLRRAHVRAWARLAAPLGPITGTGVIRDGVVSYAPAP